MPQMTVLEILNRTKAFFEKKGVPDPLLDAQYIITSCNDVPSANLCVSESISKVFQ